MKNHLVSSFFLLFCFGLVLPTYAATIYYTGFENPPFTTGAIDGQNGWATYGTSSAAQVESSVAESGSQAVDVIPSLAASQTGPYYAVSTGANEVELSAYIMIDSSSVQSNWQFAATGPALTGYIGGVNISNTGQIGLISGSQPDVGTFAYNSWQYFDFVFDFATQTYDFSLNGTLISANAPFCGSNSGCTGAPVATFGDAFFDTFPAMSANDIGYMDNITISSVPEPRLAVFLGAALLAFAALRRLKNKAASRPARLTS